MVNVIYKLVLSVTHVSGLLLLSNIGTVFSLSIGAAVYEQC